MNTSASTGGNGKWVVIALLALGVIGGTAGLWYRKPPARPTTAPTTGVTTGPTIPR